jgi:hypothetical protein
MAAPIQPGKWYLTKLSKIERKSDSKKPVVNITFLVEKGESAGEKFVDSFWLTEKALSRFECLSHRAGYEHPVKTFDDATMLSVCAEILGKRVWAKTATDDRGGFLKTDGWNFRPETDPPEEETGAIDYSKQDEEERAWDGL